MRQIILAFLLVLSYDQLEDEKLDNGKLDKGQLDAEIKQTFIFVS